MATGFSIETFRSTALKGSGARANLFDVQMTGLPGGFATTDITYTCKAAQIPGSAVTPIDVPYFGRVIKVPGNKTFENWTITIINDESFSARNKIGQAGGQTAKFALGSRNDVRSALQDVRVSDRLAGWVKGSGTTPMRVIEPSVQKSGKASSKSGVIVKAS